MKNTKTEIRKKIESVLSSLVLVIALRIITREDLKMVPKGDKIARLLRLR